jgi:HlyD family secretion protein
MDTKIDSTRVIAAPAAGPLSKPIVFIKARAKLLIIAAILLFGGAGGYIWWSRRDGAAEYTTDKVTRGSIEVNVSATGTVQAVTTVQVGSQVSGTVSWLGADFKSHVSQGQVVAKLDPALFQAQVDTARANLMNAQAGVQAAMTEINNEKANIEAAKANDAANKAARDDAIAIAKQNEKLKGIIPDRDIQSAEAAAQVAIARYNQATSQIGQAQAQLQIAQAKLTQAQAAVKQSQAQLEQANINLQHSIITSPIDGVVVSRSVDVGQTVAASLQAPTLFTIANDLTNMQVLASIDEADVGQVREHGTAHFTVDAFPRQVFNGDIIQVRLNAQTLQNVVTYTAVISVSNPDQKLMPGMTANITIPVARRDDVLKVPNAALRFKPDLSDQQQKDLQAKMDAFRQQLQGNKETEQQAGDNQPNKTQPQSKDAAASGSPGGAGGQRHGGQGQGGGPQQENTASGSGGGNWKQRHQQGQSGNAQTQTQNENQTSATDNASGGKRRGQKQDQNANAGEQAKNDQSAANDNANGGGGKRRDQEAQSGGGRPRKQGGGDSARGGGKGGRKDQTNDANKPAAGDTAQTQNQTTSGAGRGGGGRQFQLQVIWIMTASKSLESRIVRTGITDGRFTEIVASDIPLKEGDVIVTGQTEGATSNNNRSPQSTSPFGPQRPAGAGGPGRGR